MGRFLPFAVAGALIAGLSAQSQAADLLPELPLSEIEFAGSWYLRGDIGMTNQQIDKISNVDLDARGPFEFIQEPEFDSSPFISAGVGYQFNDWFRVDVTGEYRGTSTMHALDRYPDAGLPGGFGANQFKARKSEIVGLVNGYVDLGTWSGLTPYLGVGLGVAHVSISGFTDTNPVTGTVAYAPDGDKTNFAWALYAGLSYAVTPRFHVDLGYRYLNMGDGETGGPARDYAGAGTSTTPWVLETIESHDVKIGMRWVLGDLAEAAPAPTYYPEPITTKF